MKRTKQYVDKVCKDLCFGNIGYCCGLEKSCPARDKAMGKLGIVMEEYRRKKAELGYELCQRRRRPEGDYCKRFHDKPKAEQPVCEECFYRDVCFPRWAK